MVCYLAINFATKYVSFAANFYTGYKYLLLDKKLISNAVLFLFLNTQVEYCQYLLYYELFWLL